MATATKNTTSVAIPTASAWNPLQHPAFLVLWTATVVSNIGTWMHDVAAGWLMTSLAPSPLMVALVQVATTLPVFIFAIPAGALADIVDRRRLLISVMSALAVLAALLGGLAQMGVVTPWVLLTFTFLAGIGTALVAPAWQAIVPQLVPNRDLQAAIALNSVGINLSRAVGPAVGGLLIASVTMSAPFFLNALSFLGVIAALWWWRPPARHPGHSLPAERLLGAIRSGLRYARQSKPLQATLIRALAFFLFASAYWALLPLIARQLLQGGPTLYGLLLACVGAGAVSGAFFLPTLKTKLGPDKLVALATLGTALTLTVFSLVAVPAIAALVCGLAGASWIAVLSSLNASAQTALPEWVRARGLSIFIMVFFGTMTGGSFVWGQMANWIGIPPTLLIAAGAGVIAITLTWPWKLMQGTEMNLMPSMHWPEPLVAMETVPDRGPVMITVEYHIDPAARTAFLDALGKLGQSRRRDGAYTWDVFEDMAQPERFIETFRLESWAEHLRQHERVTHTDKAMQEAVHRFQRNGTAPRVTHYLAPMPNSAATTQ